MSRSKRALLIANAPRAFADVAQAHNNLVNLLFGTKGTGGIKAFVTKGNIVLTVDPKSSIPGLLYFDKDIRIDLGAEGIRLTHLATGNTAQLDVGAAIGVRNKASEAEVFMSAGTVPGFPVALNYSDEYIAITLGEGGIKLTNKATENYAQIYTNGTVGVRNAATSAEVFLSAGPDPGSPVELHYYDSSTTVTAGRDGVKVTDEGSGNFCKMYPGGSFTVYNPSGDTRDITIDPYDGSIKVINGSVSVTNGTKSITLDADGITMSDTATSKLLTLAFSALQAGKAVSLRVDDYCDGTTAKSQQHIATAPYV